MTGERCRAGVFFGVTLATRCMLPEHSSARHVGRGLRRFPYQRIEWFDAEGSTGDGWRRFETDRDDVYAWEQEPEQGAEVG